jgi:hypothetical protein
MNKESRSVLRRKAAQQGKPIPEFDIPEEGGLTGGAHGYTTLCDQSYRSHVSICLSCVYLSTEAILCVHSCVSYVSHGQINGQIVDT